MNESNQNQDTSFFGELKHIDPNRLMKDGDRDEVSDFFLQLGLFYNDLKSLTYYSVLIQNQLKDQNLSEVNITNGELAGMRIHLDRLFTGTIHEFFNFLEKNQTIFKKSEFQIVYKKLNRNLRVKWDNIIEIAIEKTSKTSTDISKILLLIRNNLAFHYQASKLLKRGFIERFFVSVKDKSNETAYYSIGENMKNTRFFYCDAAIQESIQNEIVKVMKFDDYSKKIQETINDINFSIMYLMREYLKQRPY